MAKVIGHVRRKPQEPRFRAIDDPLELRQLLEHAELTRSAVDIQFASVPLRFAGKIMEPTNSKGVTVQINPALDEKSCELIGEGTIDRDCMLVIFVRGLLLLGVRATSAEIIGGKLLKLAPPWRLFAIQRRKESRCEIPIGYELHVRIDAIEGGSRKVEKRILDISGGGIGFQVISPREASLFRTGTILRNVVFRIENRVISADLEVRNRCPIPPDRKVSGVKVGCSFSRISTRDQEFLTSWAASRLVTF